MLIHDVFTFIYIYSIHCEDQNKTLEEIGVDSAMYGEEARGAVQITGNTPKKKSYMSLEELAKTMDHNTIKMTVKKDTSEVSEVCEITFEKDEVDLDNETVETSRYKYIYVYIYTYIDKSCKCTFMHTPVYKNLLHNLFYMRIYICIYIETY
jgi:hypothetical protein